MSNQKPTSEGWKEEFDNKFVAKFYDDYGKVVEETFKFYDAKTNNFYEFKTIENEFCPPYIIKDFISTQIRQKQKEAIEAVLDNVSKPDKRKIIQSAKEKLNIEIK